MKRLRMNITMLMCLVLASCGEEQFSEQPSQLQAIKAGAYYDFFVSVQPNQLVSLCGDATAAVKRAADMWAEVIGRKGKFSYETNCIGRKRLYIREVPPGALGASVLGLAGGNSLQFVQGSGFATILHEVGHLWGLGHEPQGGANVMYPSLLGITQLTEKDRQSIREMAASPSFPANRAWATLNNTGPGRTFASCRIVNGVIGHGQTFLATDGYSYTCRDGKLHSTGGFSEDDQPGSGTEGAICKTSPKINHSLEVRYDKSCLSGGAGCIADLPCRYVN